MLFASVAIVVWIIRMFAGMSKLKQDIPMTFGKDAKPIQQLP
ncbi:hypothetical protein JCM19235_2671 [Vibrio maritimus]|uniref:Uncharacterized protein n=2 Tax=Vibrio maritimus TaxID=990268 RepID=A0A090RXE4_9VIBR|nr:hypothetical protein JCM19235_2671 [Vibrio maritimus]